VIAYRDLRPTARKRWPTLPAPAEDCARHFCRIWRRLRSADAGPVRRFAVLAGVIGQTVQPLFRGKEPAWRDVSRIISPPLGCPIQSNDRVERRTVSNKLAAPCFWPHALKATPQPWLQAFFRGTEVAAALECCGISAAARSSVSSRHRHQGHLGAKGRERDHPSDGDQDHRENRPIRTTPDHPRIVQAYAKCPISDAFHCRLLARGLWDRTCVGNGVCAKTNRRSRKSLSRFQTAFLFQPRLKATYITLDTDRERAEDKHHGRQHAL